MKRWIASPHVHPNSEGYCESELCLESQSCGIIKTVNAEDKIIWVINTFTAYKSPDVDCTMLQKQQERIMPWFV